MLYIFFVRLCCCLFLFFSIYVFFSVLFFFFFKQKTAYEMRISDWSSDVCSSDLDPPEEYGRFRERIAAADGILFCTPEYNRGVQGVLKNAIDVGSRPYGKSVWDKKPAAIISASPGSIGGFGANHRLRQSYVFVNMPVMQPPGAYVSKGTDAKLAADGCLRVG